jgi:pimeloyl-ACP methyl ester carboxylesterase
MKLRLYHHHDGARIAYREAGVGPSLCLVHSAALSHREFAPVVEHLSDRFRLVLPDLPLHGDSEDRPRHPYTPEWLTGVLAGFLQDVCGPRPLVGGHDVGAQLALRAIAAGELHPARLVLMSSALHRRPERGRLERFGRVLIRGARIPGCSRLLSHAGTLIFSPKRGDRLTVTGTKEARDLVRHAVIDLGGNANRARSWAKAARRWPAGAQCDLLDAYAAMDFPVLLLWADSDAAHPLEIAEEALEELPDGQLRVLPRTGFLVAYDDPVGLARELVAFCGSPGAVA